SREPARLTNPDLVEPVVVQFVLPDVHSDPHIPVVKKVGPHAPVATSMRRSLRARVRAARRLDGGSVVLHSPHPLVVPPLHLDRLTFQTADLKPASAETPDDPPVEHDHGTRDGKKRIRTHGVTSI